jgi:transcriptional regulator with XRE-family HTH domain
MPHIMLRMDDEATPFAEAGRWTWAFCKAFGSRLAQLRQTRGWKQKELARRAQIDSGRLSKLERGAVKANAGDLVRLSLALGIALDELVFGTVTSLDADWQRLRDEIEQAGGPPALDCATRMLRAFALSVQMGNGTPDFKNGGMVV